MTKELDLVTVVTNKLKDFREKGAQVADALQALEISRGQLAKAQSDLSEYIAEVNNLATEITTELSSAGIEATTVADSLSTEESQVYETLEEGPKPSKTAASDESYAKKKKGAIPVATEDFPEEKLDEVDEIESLSEVTVTSELDESDSDKDDLFIINEDKKPHVGLWDDDDDDATF